MAVLEEEEEAGTTIMAAAAVVVVLRLRHPMGFTSIRSVPPPPMAVQEGEITATTTIKVEI